MKIFMSWSGEKSKLTAEVLCRWIRVIIQPAEPYYSADMEKGARWNDNIHEVLASTKLGIICLTKENMDTKWINYEAGALAKHKDTAVCTFLLDIEPKDVEPPLSQFQHTSFKQEEIKKMFLTINKIVIHAGHKGLNDLDFNQLFDSSWPRIESDLKQIPIESSTALTKYQSDREVLEEVVAMQRNLLAQFEELVASLQNPNPILGIPIATDGIRNGTIRYTIGNIDDIKSCQ